MNLPLAVAVRFLALAAGLGLYYALLPWLFATGGGANIGAGLFAFAGLGLAACGWGFVDGRRQPMDRLALTWAGAGLLLGLAWAVGLSVIEPGGASMSIALGNIAFLAPFGTVLVAVPALVGGAIGRGLRPTA